MEIGVQQPTLLRQKNFSVGERLTLQVIKIGGRVEVQAVNRDEVPLYWGYQVQAEKQPFGQIISKGNFDLIIATARIGDSFTSVAESLSKRWQGAERILVAFGAPTRGLHEIASDEGLELPKKADFVVNTVPNQGTVTVRMEEALFASLAILNVQFNW